MGVLILFFSDGSYVHGMLLRIYHARKIAHNRFQLSAREEYMLQVALL